MACLKNEPNSNQIKFGLVWLVSQPLVLLRSSWVMACMSWLDYLEKSCNFFNSQLCLPHLFTFPIMTFQLSIKKFISFSIKITLFINSLHFLFHLSFHHFCPSHFFNTSLSIHTNRQQKENGLLNFIVPKKEAKSMKERNHVGKENVVKGPAIAKITNSFLATSHLRTIFSPYLSITFSILSYSCNHPTTKLFFVKYFWWTRVKYQVTNSNIDLELWIRVMELIHRFQLWIQTEQWISNFSSKLNSNLHLISLTNLNQTQTISEIILAELELTYI